MQEQNEFEQQLEARIAAMEQTGYQFPARFRRKDYLWVALVAAACLLLLIIGGAL